MTTTADLRIAKASRDAWLALPLLLDIIDALDRYQLARNAALSAGVGLCASCDTLYQEEGGVPPCGHCTPLLDAEYDALMALRKTRTVLAEWNR